MHLAGSIAVRRHSALPSDVITKKKKKTDYGKKTQKRSYEKKHHQPMMLPVLVSSFLGIIVANPSPLIAKVVRAAWEKVASVNCSKT